MFACAYVMYIQNGVIKKTYVEHAAAVCDEQEARNVNSGSYSVREEFVYDDAPDQPTPRPTDDGHEGS